MITQYRLKKSNSVYQKNINECKTEHFLLQRILNAIKSKSERLFFRLNMTDISQKKNKLQYRNIFHRLKTYLCRGTHVHTSSFILLKVHLCRGSLKMYK